MPAQPLTDTDLASLAHLGIPPELLEQAGIERVTDAEAREKFGITGSGDRAGIIFPYRDPITNVRYTARLRRDCPDIEGGKQVKKYLAPSGDPRHLYFVPGCAEAVQDVTVSVVLVEAEKSALALTAWADRASRKLLPVAMGGCWGWRGRIGKQDGPNGERVDEVGPLPELRVCAHREVFILLDANAGNNSAVRAARSALVRELLTYDSHVKVATVPEMEFVNGPDDLIAQCGDSAIQSVLELAVPAGEVAAVDAEAAIKAVDAASPREALDKVREALDAITDIPDRLQREMLERELAATRVLPKKTIAEEIAKRYRERKEKATEANRQLREHQLKLKIVPNGAKVLDNVSEFYRRFVVMSHAQRDALALWVQHTWVFQAATFTPYIDVTAPTLSCGKSRVAEVAEVLVNNPQKAEGLTKAALIRVIAEKKVTLLLDEMDQLLKSDKELAAAVTGILNDGFRKGGKHILCEPGADGKWTNREFHVFSPKMLIGIGQRPASVKSRSITITMVRKRRGEGVERFRDDKTYDEAAPLREALMTWGAANISQLAAAEPNMPEQLSDPKKRLRAAAGDS